VAAALIPLHLVVLAEAVEVFQHKLEHQGLLVKALLAATAGLMLVVVAAALVQLVMPEQPHPTGMVAQAFLRPSLALLSLVAAAAVAQGLLLELAALAAVEMVELQAALLPQAAP
jgi:hypothetical protein